ncbi:2827_t:CDS:2 [Entrophospora sp. SA101]|nr:11134_t:CDS:2 [Entrophospora candida]CAH1764129.1 15331_t:CDS:2 [Entrophospora sp. SA101]CAG8637823.1 11849_t:CDS:2 [Entrophospora candida]CAJ0631116.1 16098_t:CDS:2 [Entrophospora sp. SA101]CAJ0631122.1 16102_t:CDS:2 [Entrophospora sp. SA101]
MSLKLYTTTVIVALISIGVYLLKQQTDELMGVKRKIGKNGLDKCRKVLGPSYCEDVKIHRPSGLAFMTCDNSRAEFNPLLGLGDPNLVNENGSIWIFDLNVDDPPIRLDSDFKRSFHPIGISVATLNDSKNSKTATLKIAVINYDDARRSVEIFDYSREEKFLYHRKTIISRYIYNPNRIIAVSNMPSPDGIPSFFVTNDHYFINSDLQKIEDYITLPLGTFSFYNAFVNRSVETGWRLQHPTGIVATDDSNQIFITNAWSGEIQEFNAFFFNRETLNINFNTVDYHHGNKEIDIFWPLYLTMNSIKLGFVATGIDFDPITKDLYTVGHPKYYNYLAYANSIVSNDSNGNKKNIIKISPSLVTKSTFKQPPTLTQNNNHFPEQKKFFVKNVYTTKIIFEDDGSTFGSSTGVAIDVGRSKLLIVGNYEHGFMECKLN